MRESIAVPLTAGGAHALHTAAGRKRASAAGGGVADARADDLQYAALVEELVSERVSISEEPVESHGPDTDSSHSHSQPRPKPKASP